MGDNTGVNFAFVESIFTKNLELKCENSELMSDKISLKNKNVELESENTVLKGKIATLEKNIANTEYESKKIIHAVNNMANDIYKAYGCITTLRKCANDMLFGSGNNVEPCNNDDPRNNNSHSNDNVKSYSNETEYDPDTSETDYDTDDEEYKPSRMIIDKLSQKDYPRYIDDVKKFATNELEPVTNKEDCTSMNDLTKALIKNENIRGWGRLFKNHKNCLRRVLDDMGIQKTRGKMVRRFCRLKRR